MIKGTLNCITSKLFTFMLKPSAIFGNTFMTSFNTVKYQTNNRCFSNNLFQTKITTPLKVGVLSTSNNLKILPVNTLFEQTRSMVKSSWRKGKRTTVKEVPEKFFRLRWGMWIRTITARHKRVWKKKGRQKNRALQHVFCNKTQCKKLDIMVSKYWRTPKYYLEDPYEPYHKRDEYYYTNKKPWRPEGVDYE